MAARRRLRTKPYLTAILAVAGAAALAIGITQVSASEPPTVSCGPPQSTYGDPIDCFTTGADSGAVLRWSDGSTSSVDAVSHTPHIVGTVAVSLLDDDGLPVAETTIQVSPDLELVCEETFSLPVYELVESEGDSQKWGYIYVNESGHTISPGDLGYPVDAAGSKLERVELQKSPQVGRCVATSRAAEDLEGDLSITMATAWDEPHTVALKKLVPWTQQGWEGVQPGQVSATVSVAGVSVTSAEQDIYILGRLGCT